MPLDRFMIAPINTGLQTDIKPWLIPDDAFARLQNAYVFRGRVRKRFGSYLLNGAVSSAIAQLFSRLRINVGTTDGSGNASGTVPGAIFDIGQLFSIGSEIYTVFQTGTPAAMLDTGSTATATYNTSTGAFNFVGAPINTDVFFYPAQPVMGLITYETATINDEPVFAFDTQFAYKYNGTSWQRLDGEASPGASVWTGTNSDFFWGYTYRGVSDSQNFLFVTNFVIADEMRFFNGTTNQWNFFAPIYNSGGDTIETARIMVPFKNRLVLLNTVEVVSASNTSFVNRCRFSQNGDPTASDAFREDIPGKGGYVDLPVKEIIVTAQFLKDRLIVYCETSTWELVYIGNESLPFVWQQINTELGAESTFSEVPFDKVILGVGNVGVHACNGSNVERIDEKIPTSVFEVSNDNEGVFRVYGIRDYFAEMVYWSFPSEEHNTVFPNRILVYNYRTQSWAFNDDSITAFGYFQQQPNSTSWNSTNDTWQESEEPWNSGELNKQFLQVIAGNQEGFTFIVDIDESRNAPALQITNLTIVSPTVTIVAINHNFQVNDWVIIENAQGIVAPITGIYQVEMVIDANTFTILAPDISGTYTGGGTIARASRIDIWTKQYNFYVDKGRNVSISKVDFLVDRTGEGEITVDFFPSSTELSMIQDGQATGAIVGNNVLETTPYVLYPLEQQQDRLWHPIYLQADGECIQLRIYLSDDQMAQSNVVFSDFQLNAMTFYAQPTSQRLQ